MHTTTEFTGDLPENFHPHFMHAPTRRIFTRGNADLLYANPLVAITGTRACTAYGDAISTNTAAAATRQGATIINGGAYGIEAAALRAALAAGGSPIVWLAHGLDHTYPRTHTRLFTDILDAGGLLLSMHPDGESPNFPNYRQRNVALAHAVHLLILPEAPEGDESLSMARTGLNDRPSVVVPGPLTSAASAGSNALLHDPCIGVLTDTAHPLSALS